MATWAHHGKKIARLARRALGSTAKLSARGTGKILSVGTRAVTELVKTTLHQTRSLSHPSRTSTRYENPSSHASSTHTHPHSHHSSTSSTPDHVVRRPAGNQTRAVNTESEGLPRFSYSPFPDAQADPGEVVWAWVPYQDNPTIGKDRPVVVLAREGQWLIVAQMTSKDHDKDAEQEASQGRFWVNVGTGKWDAQRRNSFARIDRLLRININDVRREGASIERPVYQKIVKAIRSFHTCTA